MSQPIRNPALLALLASAAVAMAQRVAAQPPAPTVRICDNSGCSDRPRDSATFDPLADDNPEETRRIQALSDIAAKDPRAAYDLGMRYLRGDGVKRDGSTGIHWLREAGDRGDLRAQAALGHLYLAGLEEMGSDPAEAEKWLSLAAERGDKESARLLPEAQKAKRDEQARYKLREDARKNGWGWWYASYPYYWTWQGGWYVGR